MQALTGARWILLGFAFACGAAFTLLVHTQNTTVAGAAVFEVLFPLIGIIQAVGTFAATRHLKQSGQPGGWAMFVGYFAAVVWLIGFASAAAAQAAGPGGIVYGLLITLPAIYLGPLLQAGALFLFRARERALASAKPATGSGEK